jgi:hypothetical protein
MGLKSNGNQVLIKVTTDRVQHREYRKHNTITREQ